MASLPIPLLEIGATAFKRSYCIQKIQAAKRYGKGTLWEVAYPWPQSQHPLPCSWPRQSCQQPCLQHPCLGPCQTAQCTCLLPCQQAQKPCLQQLMLRPGLACGGFHFPYHASATERALSTQAAHAFQKACRSELHLAVFWVPIESAASTHQGMYDCIKFAGIMYQFSAHQSPTNCFVCAFLNRQEC